MTGKIIRFIFCLWLISGITDLVHPKSNLKSIVNRVSPAVVSVLAYDAQNRLIRNGTGFNISPHGIIVSNFRAIKDAFMVTVKTERLEAYYVNGVIAYDVQLDFVILKITGADMPYCRMGKSDEVVVGEKVIAVGRSRAGAIKLAHGSISQRKSIYATDFLYVQLSLAKESHGSPLLNRDGKVVGITTANLADESNITLACSIDALKRVLLAGVEVNHSLSAISGWENFTSNGLVNHRTKPTEFTGGGSRKSPGRALMYSALLPGVGQYYNGSILKGLLQQVIIAGGLVAALGFGDDYERYSYAVQKSRRRYNGYTGRYETEYYYDYEYAYEDFKTAWFYAGLGTAGLVYIWSIIDASFTAKKINRKNSSYQYGHLFEFNRSRYALGLDLQRERDSLQAVFAVHF